MKFTLVIISILIIPFNSVICDIIYPGNTDKDITNWWWLRMDIVALSWLLSALTIGMKTPYGKEYLIKFLQSIYVGFCVSDIIDRWYFHDRTPFSLVDLITITFILLISYNKNIRKALKQDHAGKV